MLEVRDAEGDGEAAQLEGYTAAGKTGTAQKIDPKTRAYSKTKYVASFVGFAPVENPSVVIIVVIDEPVGAYHGGEVAAPVFREIADQILPYLNVRPDDEMKKRARRRRRAASRGDRTGAANADEEGAGEGRVSLPEVVRAGRGGRE